MKTPFTFGKIAQDNDFTDREKETRRLVSNFNSSVNTILISPRRWGKSSLVLKAAGITKGKDKKIRFCFVDLNNVRTEEQFYQQLATEILRSSSTKIETIIGNAKRFMGSLIPSLTFGTGQISDIKISLDWKEVSKNPDNILNMAEKICKEGKIRLVICIDEFQNISGFEDPLGFQKKLRAHWQLHRYVTYCLYGSKRHMMMDVFTSPSMPFYKFGDILFLEKISLNDWITFIKKRFSDTKKEIGTTDAKLIAELAECHPYYVQQLAQQAWLRSYELCSSTIIHEAFEDIVLQLSMLFQALVDGLSNSQINLLKALICNEKQLSSQNVLKEYQLGTSANVLKIKKMLSNKEIIDLQGDSITFIDPMYKFWLKKYYFKLS
ncbi:MAG: ATP-binding protein [Bacteroidales bacterium]|jgi:AAA+ ATPase superfamily predicted ATPase|nr:ATP-binding protein [Bacteroidales bacterium]OQB60932.1 MAG: Archaeal ATPase [Bacteroidetes bacterium ADurb.Bin145]HOU02377.1 ATPase [Bacteroidales bacterium]